jgi:CRISP-associated protein Cas1
MVCTPEILGTLFCTQRSFIWRRIIYFFDNDSLRTDYVIRIPTEAMNKKLTEFDRQASQTVKCGSRQKPWGNIIGIKAYKIANNLTDKRKTMDLSTPSPDLQRVDSADIRKKILGLSYYHWHKLSYSKGTLYYMKKNARENKPFTLNQHVKERMDTF